MGSWLNKEFAQVVKRCYKAFMIVHGFVDDKHIKKEKEKARVLRKSPWWKQLLAQGKCHYCQKTFTREDLTMDHITPISRGGRTVKGNVAVACKPCNSEKKYYTPAEMVMLKKEAAVKAFEQG